MLPSSHHTLTIAIPFYKGAEFLRQAISSVLVQSSSQWKLIVCDDGSESGIDRLVASFNNPAIRYFKNETNLGMAGNWNRCLDLADTDLVELLHNDDQLLPNYVEQLVLASAQFPEAAAFYCRAKVIDARGHDVFSFVDSIKQYLQPKGRGAVVLKGHQAIEALMHGNFIMCPTVCYRKSRLGRERFDSRWRFVLDIEYYIRLFLAGQSIVGLPDIAYAYRRHADNATTAYTETLTRFEEESQLHNQVAILAHERGWPALARVAARKRILRLHLVYRIVCDVGRLRFAPALRKWKFLRRLVSQPVR